MKLKEIMETVVKGDFGKGHDISDQIDIPKGYKSFYVKAKGKVGTIIGVKTDGTEDTLSTTNLELAKYIGQGLQ